MMGGFILGFLDIIAIIVLLIGYLVLFIPILGVDEVKRYPSASILSLALVYLESLACGYFWEEPTVKVMIALLIGGILVALLVSFFSGKKGSPLYDALVFIVFLVGAVYILYSHAFIKIINKINDITNQGVSTNTYIGLTIIALLSLFTGYAVATLYNLYKRINALDYKIDKRYKQNANIQSFNEPYQKYLRDDIKDMIEKVKRDVIEEVRLSNFESSLGPVLTPMDDLSKLTREIKGLKKIIKKDIRRQEGFGVGDFVSDVKHSLMTPLSQILSNCELLEDELTSDRTRQGLDRIEKNVKAYLNS